MVSIAIDGPAGAGKSTVAKKIAKILKYVYVDTGSLYRAIAFYIIENKICIDDPKNIINSLHNIDIKIEYENSTQKINLNLKDVSDKIRTNEISMLASQISAIKEVRDFLLALQRNIAKQNNVVMDGRDIGTVILPFADIKIFLTASAKKRSIRRYRQLLSKGIKSTYNTVFKEILIRDKNDSNRSIAPLKPAKDSIIVDSTNLTLNESINKILNIILDYEQGR